MEEINNKEEPYKLHYVTMHDGIYCYFISKDIKASEENVRRVIGNAVLRRFKEEIKKLNEEDKCASTLLETE